MKIYNKVNIFFSTLTLLVGQHEGYHANKKPPPLILQVFSSDIQPNLK